LPSVDPIAGEWRDIHLSGVKPGHLGGHLIARGTEKDRRSTSWWRVELYAGYACSELCGGYEFDATALVNMMLKGLTLLYKGRLQRVEY
jgi:hypothetical protein